MARRIELCYMTLSDCGLRERIRIAETVGYDQVGLRLVPVSSEDVVEPILTDPALKRQIVRALRDAGISAGGIELVRLTPDIDITGLAPLFTCAAELGAKQLLVLGDDPELSRLTDHFHALCEAAASYDLMPQLEFAIWSGVPSLAAARNVVEHCGHPAGGILIDALHMHLTGASLDEMRATPSNCIRSLQLCDTMSTYDRSWDAMKMIARRNRLPPGHGELDLVELVRATPVHSIIGSEVPNAVLQAQLGAEQHARSVLEATKHILQIADNIR